MPALAPIPEPYPGWLPARLREFWKRSALDVLRATLVGEAEGESYAGMFAVGCVIRNRLWFGWGWATRYQEVCLQPHQFSCWWADFSRRAPAMRSAIALPHRYQQANRAAIAVLANDPDITGTACHYFNPHVVKPSWAADLVRTARIGGHDFYTLGW